MHNAYLPPAEWTGNILRLGADESRHLVSSLRAAAGDRLVVFDGRGRSAEAEITAVERNGKSPSVICSVIRLLPAREPSTKLTLLQALPKGSRMDFIVEKATELGVWQIVPLKTDRVEKQAGGKGYPGQVERWERVALSAAKQCGSPWLPAIHGVQSLDRALPVFLEGVELFAVCVLDEAAEAFGDVLERIGRNAASVAVLIGPEGDLTEEEIAVSVAAGAVPVNFGSLVLRVETAAIYAASVLKNHFRWDRYQAGPPVS